MAVTNIKRSTIYKKDGYGKPVKFVRTEISGAEVSQNDGMPFWMDEITIVADNCDPTEGLNVRKGSVISITIEPAPQFS